MTVPFTAFVLSIISITIWRLLQVSKRPPGYPPGPPTLPLIGNLHQIPKERSHLQFKKWAEEYGPIYSLVMGTRTVIVLSKDTVVKDLLDKRGNIYSSRPSSYVTTLATGDLSFAMMKYNDTWKLCHRLFANSLSSRAAKSYVPHQDIECKQMLRDLLRDSSSFKSHVRRYTYSLMTHVVLGFRTTSISDPRLQQLYSGFEKWSELMGEAISVLVDLYPFLQNLPDRLLPVRKYAQDLHTAEKNLFLSHWDSLKSQLSQSKAPDCVAKDIAKAQQLEGFSDDLAAYTCGFLLIAGSDTIATQLVVFIQAMLLFPDVQRTAQAEIDKVCGDRLPSLEDPLPYLRAVIKESCRWMPAAVLGVPHAVIKDDHYMGYHIPKDAIVLLNVWAIHTDTTRHSDPRRFDPTRYLKDTKSARESALSTDVTERDHFLFGAGRRLCAGMDIAENSLFLGMSRILWAFNINRAKDKAGRLIDIDPEDIIGGLAAYPRDFPADFVPRSTLRAKEIEQQWELTLNGET